MRQQSPDSRALVLAAYRATEYAFTPATRATWDEIVASGDVGLLPTDATRVLAPYYSVDLALDARDTFRASPYRVRVRRLISYEVQDAIRSGAAIDSILRPTLPALARSAA